MPARREERIVGGKKGNAICRKSSETRQGLTFRSDQGSMESVPTPEKLSSFSMNRRRWFGTGLAAGAVTLGLRNGPAAQAQEKGNDQALSGHNAHVYRFTLGECEAAVISDGQKFRDGALGMILTDDKEAVADALEAAYEPRDGFSADYNVLVLKKGDRIALFDTGSGGDGLLHDGLKQLGIELAQVTDILISHCHGDHIGGLLDSEGALIFPQAKAHILKVERDFWSSENPDFSQSALPADKTSGMAASASGILSKLDAAGVLENRADGDQLWDGIITYRHAPGHTPGHAIFELKSGDDALVHIVDLAHHYVIMFADPSWAIAFDVAPEEAIETRKRVFSEMAERRVPVIGYHLPFPALGHIASEGEGYRWVAGRWVYEV